MTKVLNSGLFKILKSYLLYDFLFCILFYFRLFQQYKKNVITKRFKSIEMGHTKIFKVKKKRMQKSEIIIYKKIKGWVWFLILIYTKVNRAGISWGPSGLTFFFFWKSFLFIKSAHQVFYFWFYFLERLKTIKQGWALMGMINWIFHTLLFP